VEIQNIQHKKGQGHWQHCPSGSAPLKDHNFPYTIQVYLSLWDESDHLHGLCRSHAMLDIRWNIEYVTLLKIRLLVINLADALAT